MDNLLSDKEVFTSVKLNCREGMGVYLMKKYSAGESLVYHMYVLSVQTPHFVWLHF